MRLLLFNVFKHLLLRKADNLKTCQKSKFLGKKIWTNTLALKSKKVQGILGKMFILALSSAAFRLQKHVSDFFTFFCSGDRRLLSEFLRKWGWFHGHNEDFHKYLHWELKFQKTKTQSCRWKNTDNNDINIFLSLENPVPFCLGKKRPGNAFLTLTVNYLRIVQKNKLLFKTAVNCLFNDIWCYLVIACFN